MYKEKRCPRFSFLSANGVARVLGHFLEVVMAEKNEPSSLGELLNAKKVADLLGIRPWTVYQLVKRGQLPAIKIGGRIMRFRLKSIENWMTAREAESLAR